MHRDDFDSINFEVVKRNQTLVIDIMKALSSPQIANEFPMLGWSNWTSDRVNESLLLSQKNPQIKAPQFNSPYFSLFKMGSRSIHARGIQVSHEDMMDKQFQKGIYLNTYSPLGGFSILDKPNPSWENAKKEAKAKLDTGDAYWKNVYQVIFTKENEERYLKAGAFLNKYNQKNKSDFTMDQLVNAYALAHPRLNFLTIGPINVEQVNRTVKSLELAKSLSPADLDHLNYNRFAKRPIKTKMTPLGLSCKKIFFK